MTRCGQLDGILQERGETLFSLEADRDQVSSVVPSEVEGASAVDRCTPSLGDMEAPGTLGGTRFPSVIVPVCVVKGVSGVVTSVPGCVLPSMPCVKGAPRVKEAAGAPEMARVSEQPCVSERPSVRGTACVRSLYVREMTVGMREHAAASPGVNVMEWCLSVMTRRCSWVEWRRRRRQRDEG